MHHHNRTESESGHIPSAGKTHDEGYPGGTATAPTHEEIALRAYDIYSRNGRNEGHSRQDWEQAEHELRGRSRHH